MYQEVSPTSPSGWVLFHKGKSGNEKPGFASRDFLKQLAPVYLIHTVHTLQFHAISHILKCLESGIPKLGKVHILSSQVIVQISSNCFILIGFASHSLKYQAFGALLIVSIIIHLFSNKQATEDAKKS